MIRRPALSALVSVAAVCLSASTALAGEPDPGHADLFQHDPGDPRITLDWHFASTGVSGLVPRSNVETELEVNWDDPVANNSNVPRYDNGGDNTGGGTITYTAQAHVALHRLARLDRVQPGRRHREPSTSTFGRCPRSALPHGCGTTATTPARTSTTATRTRTTASRRPSASRSSGSSPTSAPTTRCVRPTTTTAADDETIMMSVDADAERLAGPLEPPRVPAVRPRRRPARVRARRRGREATPTAST